jgi:hypothetical protein
MLMSKSRLEKFLYALYSLDHSDLPTPLSRIEELYKCWVTGEEPPTFKPLSRVEKYLMAILGAYDVDELPNPLSRVEVLLYKLATGDDNLDDVKSFLSEHEELLADIIRNGGVGGDIDIEYVLYTLSTEFNTLYNTAEKPVKSAILKGQTLVNRFSESTLYYELNSTHTGNKTINLTSTGAVCHSWWNVNLQTTKQYMLSINIIENTSTGNLIIKTGDEETLKIFDVGVTGKQIIIFTPTNSGIRFKYESLNTGTTVIDEIMLIEYQDGMENWNIPYFEGMQSVKMPVLTTTGKNIFNPNWLINDDTKHGISVVDGEVILNGEFTRSATWFEFKLPKGTYKPTNFNTSDISVHVFWLGKDNFFTYEKPLTYDAETTIKGYIAKGVYDNHVLKLQLESGTNQSTYEPYKSNILTVNEDVTLRSNGDVYDELNLLTGRLTQRIDENNEVLSQEVVKTVDLSVLDRDENNTRLSTFNDITHVVLSSEGLIPGAELEVATKNEEVLNTMSLEMDDIFTTQTALGETINTQSENVDATMIATTEIYEELL